MWLPGIVHGESSASRLCGVVEGKIVKMTSLLDNLRGKLFPRPHGWSSVPSPCHLALSFTLPGSGVLSNSPRGDGGQSQAGFFLNPVPKLPSHLQIDMCLLKPFSRVLSAKPHRTHRSPLATACFNLQFGRDIDMPLTNPPRVQWPKTQGSPRRGLMGAVPNSLLEVGLRGDHPYLSHHHHGFFHSLSLHGMPYCHRPVGEKSSSRLGQRVGKDRRAVVP
ncbi:hypothetical protein QBC39DRAFT_357853 [Podospora conica]|nr:hypothetical protein QBC39DRAFT_357853 [Schizothecium conicum]